MYKKRACEFNIKAQNIFLYVKIGLRILTTNFTKTDSIVQNVKHEQSLNIKS